MKIKTMKPYLTESDGILTLQFDEWSTQSEMSIDDTDELVVPYTRVIMSFLLLEPSPGHVAMIGLGGGSLAKYCYRYLPDTEITAVEINPDVIALRNEFAIPADDARYRVLLGDGAEWVSDTTIQPDVLIVDGFDADGLPAQLCSQRFYDDCFAALADNGIMVVNMWKGYPHYDEYIACITNSFAGNRAIVDAQDGFNHIVLAVKSTEFPPSASTIRHHAKLLCQSHPLNFQALANMLLRSLPTGADIGSV
jgi:spermidine synthase